MKDVFVRSAHNYDVDAASNESAIRCEDDSRTHQSFAEECDINTIVRRFGVTGELPDVRMPTYGDFIEVTDFQSAMNAVVAARESFDLLPANVRAEFRNDPGLFVDFCSDEKNAERMAQMGLLSEEGALRVKGAKDAELIKYVASLSEKTTEFVKDAVREAGVPGTES